MYFVLQLLISKTMDKIENRSRLLMCGYKYKYTCIEKYTLSLVGFALDLQ